VPMPTVVGTVVGSVAHFPFPLQVLQAT